MFQPGANLYTQGFGSRPENVEVPHLDVRDPAVSDVLYPIGKRWVNTIAGTEFFLPNFSVVNGVTNANWSELQNSSSALDTLSNGTTKVSPDVTGNISIEGTANQITVTSFPGSNNLTLSIPTPFIVPEDETINGMLTVTGEIIGHTGTAIDGGAVSIETGANPFTVNTSSSGNITIGNLSGGAVGIISGTGGITLDSPNGGTITIAPSHINILNIGSSNLTDISIASQTVDFTTFGSGVSITTTGGSTNINTTSNGNTNIGNSGTVNINSGAGGVNIGASGNVINIGNNGNQLNINSSGNGGVQLGNNSGTSTTSIDGGTGGIKIGATTGSNTNIQIGPNEPNIDTGNILLNPGALSGCILLNGGQRVLVNPIATSAGPLTTANFFLPCDTTTAPFTVTLPASPALGQQFVIADISGAAVSNTLTISGNGQMINGNPTATITTPYGRAILFYTGTAWSR